MDYNFNKNKPLPVIILLGGKGSRFSNIDQEPKQLVRLNKKFTMKKTKKNDFIDGDFEDIEDDDDRKI